MINFKLCNQSKIVKNKEDQDTIQIGTTMPIITLVIQYQSVKSMNKWVALMADPNKMNQQKMSRQNSMNR